MSPVVESVESFSVPSRAVPLHCFVPPDLRISSILYFDRRNLPFEPLPYLYISALAHSPTSLQLPT